MRETKFLQADRRVGRQAGGEPTEKLPKHPSYPKQPLQSETPFFAESLSPPPPTGQTANAEAGRRLLPVRGGGPPLRAVPHRGQAEVRRRRPGGPGLGAAAGVGPAAVALPPPCLPRPFRMPHVPGANRCPRLLATAPSVVHVVQGSGMDGPAFGKNQGEGRVAFWFDDFGFSGAQWRY